MRPETIKVIRPQRKKSTLLVEIYRTKNKDEVTGAWLKIVTRQSNGNMVWISVHPNDVDELIEMLKEGKEIAELTKYSIGELREYQKAKNGGSSGKSESGNSSESHKL